MTDKYNVYKGLQKPLVYKGFKGKFIYWGLGFVLSGLIAGAVSMAVINKLFGAMVLLGSIIGGLFYTATQQKKGLHTKKRYIGLYVHRASLKQLNSYDKEERI
ncbi:MAG: plasmid transfer protein [Sphingobacteriaceae bacterium]|nr:MAG: plasmid transfer protein [Sphingobacteriaceae bacterium]